MENLNSKFSELSVEEINDANGGGFAYDVGFFLRAMIVGANNPALISIEYGVNYRPVN